MLFFGAAEERRRGTGECLDLLFITFACGVDGRGRSRGGKRRERKGGEGSGVSEGVGEGGRKGGAGRGGGGRRKTTGRVTNHDLLSCFT